MDPGRGADSPKPTDKRRTPEGSTLRERASAAPRRPRSVARALLALILLVCLCAGVVAAGRAASFLSQFTNPLEELGWGINPAGSVPWKLKHGQQVNLLLLGYGGSENDAPFLTDTVMVISLDPAHNRAMEVSIPRDLSVEVDTWVNRRPATHKVNEAYTIAMDNASWPGKRSEFASGKDRGGRLAQQTVAGFTGLHFDGYIAVDFKAFRDLVNALGGVQVCLDGPLDDYQYPDYRNGYVKGGIHYKKGCQQVNGEQALQLARSRHAVQQTEAGDFGRAQRQQLILNAIRNKATSVNAITRARELMEALQKDFDTSLTISDMKALYDWSRGLSDGRVGRLSISTADFLDQYYLRRGTCGNFNEYTLCPEDPSYRALRSYFSNLFVDPQVLKEAAPVQVVNSSRTLDDLGDRVSSTLQPLGFKVEPAVRMRPAEKTVVYDYSGGRYPLTAQWLAAYFGGPVVTPATAAPPTPSPPAGGLAVVLGHQYALRWIGQGQ